MGPTPAFAEDDLISELQRAGQRDSLTGPPNRTRRQKVLLVAVVLALIGAAIGVTAWIRQPDPYTRSTLVPWSHPVVSKDGRDITVSYTGGACGIESVRTIVQETAAQVSLTVVRVVQYADDHVSCIAIGFTGKAVATLTKPLGTRALVDGRCHQPTSVDAVALRC